MRTGGDARFFCVIKNVDELKEAVLFSKEKDLRFFILGGGSNLIFPDNGFDGLIIKNEIKGIDIKDIDDNFRLVKIGAGEIWDEVVISSLNNKLYGLENLSYIPGTVGASAVQNIGAYGVEAKDFIEEVEVFDSKDFKIYTLSNSECLFGYRDSVFKKKKNLIIFSVTYKLSKKFLPNFKYSELKNIFSNKTVDNFSAEDVREAVIKLRKSKLPEVSELGSVGSFFKNPVLLKEEHEKLLITFPNLLSFVVDENRVKIPLGFILDKICSLKGYKEGDVGLYEKQALVIVNYGKATSLDIINFSKEIKKIVKEKIGLEVEEEAEILL